MKRIQLLSFSNRIKVGIGHGNLEGISSEDKTLKPKLTLSRPSKTTVACAAGTTRHNAANKNEGSRFSTTKPSASESVCMEQKFSRVIEMDLSKKTYQQCMPFGLEAGSSFTKSSATIITKLSFLSGLFDLILSNRKRSHHRPVIT